MPSAGAIAGLKPQRFAVEGFRRRDVARFAQGRAEREPQFGALRIAFERRLQQRDDLGRARGLAHQIGEIDQRLDPVGLLIEHAAKEGLGGAAMADGIRGPAEREQHTGIVRAER